MLTLLSKLHGRLVFPRRINILAKHLHELLPSGTSSILDVGCGDGSIAARLSQLNPHLHIEGLEIQPRPQTHIPVQTFDGLHLPHPDRSADVVMLVDVLHHTNDPVILMTEASRVARRGILIKDHLQQHLLDRACLRLMDWVGNQPHGVVLPYTYWTQSQWRTAWDNLGLRMECQRTRLDLYPAWAGFLFERNLHFMALLTG